MSNENQATHQSQAARPISLIIPTWNEAAELPETLRRARLNPEIDEIIVVDGGSDDTTSELAAAAGCRVCISNRSRGAQLRRGAEQAKGDVLVFLHADTWLPQGAGRAVLDCLRDPRVVGGGFWKVFRDGSWLMRGSRARCALRLWVGGLLLGDQGIFVRRDALERVGGMPDLALMEDFELCRRLRRVGRLVLAPATVSTSARRFLKAGVARTYWRMTAVTLGYWLGASPDRLRRMYEGQ